MCDLESLNNSPLYQLICCQLCPMFIFKLSIAIFSLYLLTIDAVAFAIIAGNRRDISFHMDNIIKTMYEIQLDIGTNP